MNIEKLQQQLTAHEGIKLKPYKCSEGYWTIGVGRNMEAHPVDEDLGRHVSVYFGQISREEAMALLAIDIQRAFNDLDKLSREGILPSLVDLSEPRKHVLIDMMFNLGFNSFMEFKNFIHITRKAAHLAQKGMNSDSELHFKAGALEILHSRYATQVKKRANVLAIMWGKNRDWEGVARLYKYV